MRTIEKIIITAATVIFITLLGKGVFTVYVRDFQTGLSIIEELGKNSLETSGALVALVIGVTTLISSMRGKKKRKR